MKDLLPGLGGELALVDKYIGEFLWIQGENEGLSNLFALVAASRGKMLRPALLLLAGRFGPHYPARVQPLCKLAAMLEMVHMASLIHDDIIDDSPLRRGLPTLQTRFGKDMAVYAGDFILNRVIGQLFRENMSQAGLIISRTIEEMCLGELGQMCCRWDTQTSIASYLRNIRSKSAVLFASALTLGALESGCPKRQIPLLTAIGRHMGYMFQMRDDFRDCLTPEARQGKPAHQDFAAGIYTLPVLYALRHSPQGDRLRQLAALEAEDLPLPELTALIEASGGLEFTRRRIERQAGRARLLLGQLPANEAAKALETLLCRLQDCYGEV